MTLEDVKADAEKLAVAVCKTIAAAETMEEEQKKLIATINEICAIAKRMKTGINGKED
jgi:hypothetical protein